MNRADIEPIKGKRVLFSPRHVAIRLDEAHRRAYRRLFGLLFPLADVPALKDHDFDGRSIKVTRPQLAALNRAFGSLNHAARPGMHDAFDGQERALTNTSKRIQFLS